MLKIPLEINTSLGIVSPSSRAQDRIRIIIFETPIGPTTIQFIWAHAGRAKSKNFIYSDKVLQSHIISEFEHRCRRDGCNTSNRRLFVCVDEEDFKINSANSRPALPEVLVQNMLFSNARLMEFKHGIQLYFSNQISIHGRKFEKECCVYHSPSLCDEFHNNEFGCYPRVTFYEQGAPDTSTIGLIKHA